MHSRTYAQTQKQANASCIHTGQCSPHTYRLLSMHTQQATAVRTHTDYWACIHNRPLQSTHIEAIECVYITGHCTPRTYRLLSGHTQQATAVRTHTGYWVCAHNRPLQSVHIQAISFRTRTVPGTQAHTGYCSPHIYRLLPPVIMC